MSPNPPTNSVQSSTNIIRFEAIGEGSRFVTSETSLKIDYPEAVLADSLRSEYHTWIGETLKLFLMGKNIPPDSEVTWLHNGRKIRSESIKILRSKNTFTLLVAEVNESHAGTYDVTIEVPNGQILTSQTQVYVAENSPEDEKPKPSNENKILTNLPAKLKGQIYGEVSISCQVSSNECTVKWFKDNKRVSSFKRLKITQEENFRTLTITNLQKSDIGVYTCETSTKDKTSTQLEVVGEEKVKRETVKLAVDGDKITSNSPKSQKRAQAAKLAKERKQKELEEQGIFLKIMTPCMNIFYCTNYFFLFFWGQFLTKIFLNFLANNDRKKASAITLQLEELLDRIRATEASIYLKITQPIATDYPSCQQSIRFIQSTISDLRAYKTQKDKLAIDATCLEQSNHTPDTLPKIRNLLKAIHNVWNVSWQTSNLYLEKGRKVLLVLQSTRTIDDTLVPLENKIQENLQLPTDSQGLRRQQHIFRDLKLSLEGLEPSVISLKAEAEDTVEAAGCLVEFIAKIDNQNANQILEKLQSCDGQIYTTKVQQVVDRWQKALDLVEGRIQELDILIPEAEDKEAQHLRYQNLHLHLEELQRQLDIIKNEANPVMNKPAPDSDTFVIETAIHQASRWMSDMKALKESINMEQDSLQFAQLDIDSMKNITNSFDNLLNNWTEFRDKLHLYWSWRTGKSGNIGRTRKMSHSFPGFFDPFRRISQN